MPPPPIPPRIISWHIAMGIVPGLDPCGEDPGAAGAGADGVDADGAPG
jgi:hypothetical protein